MQVPLLAPSPTPKKKILTLLGIWVAVCVGAAVLVLMIFPAANTTSADASTVSRLAAKPGDCPKPHGYGICVMGCEDDWSCDGDKKCCSNGCGRVCMPAQNVVLPSLHAGSCPVVNDDAVGDCVEMCEIDDDCAIDQKCCSNGCGHQCVSTSHKVCCHAVTPSCRACHLSITVDEFCHRCSALGMNDLACRACPSETSSSSSSSTESSEETDSVTDEHSEVAEDTPVCCEALTVECRACHHRLSVDEFCDRCDTLGLNDVGCRGCHEPLPTLIRTPSLHLGKCPQVSPGTFGICVELCSNDEECNADEKCCSNGCGHVCRKAVFDETTVPTEEESNESTDTTEETGCCEALTVRCRACHHRLSVEEFCDRCLNLGLNDVGCRGCSRSSASEDSEPSTDSDDSELIIEHDGMCPDIPDGVVGLCVERCSSDNDCAYNEKCCSNGCGHECKAMGSSPRACCAAITAPCSACQHGLTVPDFCQKCEAHLISDLGCRDCALVPVVHEGACPAAPSTPGLCVESCSSDSDCATTEKCCSNGCGHECTPVATVLRSFARVPEAPVAREGPFEYCGGFAGFRCSHGSDMCLVPPNDVCDPRTGGADCMGVCVDSSVPCTSNANCPGTSQCVPTLCGSDSCPSFCTRQVTQEMVNAVAATILAAQQTHQGFCPRPVADAGICSEDCSTDADCGDHEKCCSNGCGHTCMVSLPFNCLTREVWSEPKKNWCCEHMGLGCASNPQTVCCDAITAPCRACALSLTVEQFCGRCSSGSLTDDACRDCQLVIPRRMFALAAFVTTKECPAPTSVGPCVELCLNDVSCGAHQRCCSNGCGHVCVDV